MIETNVNKMGKNQKISPFFCIKKLSSFQIECANLSTCYPVKKTNLIIKLVKYNKLVLYIKNETKI